MCVSISDLLGKSLQVSTSSIVLLQKLRQLQRTEALQRRGGVVQEEEVDDEEVELCSNFPLSSCCGLTFDAHVPSSSQSSRCSTGVVLRLEELVEALQDRRRRVDQAVRLQLQQVENSFKREPESRQGGPEVRNKLQRRL